MTKKLEGKNVLNLKLNVQAIILSNERLYWKKSCNIFLSKR